MANAAFDYGRVTNSGRPLAQRVSRRLLVLLFRRLVRLEVAGLSNLPDHGGYVLVANHLHALDPAIGLLLVPGRVTGIAKEKWNRPPFRWLLRAMSDVLFVGASNRRTLDLAALALASGSVVAILPEGTRSRTGTLAPGQRGAALLASRAQVPVVPAAAHGQEQAIACWRRRRRVPVHVSIGRPLPPPPLGATRAELEAYTDRLMREVAALLPEAYRGVYADRA